MPWSCFSYSPDVPLGTGNRSAAQSAPRDLPSMPGGHPFISYPGGTCFSYRRHGAPKPPHYSVLQLLTGRLLSLRPRTEALTFSMNPGENTLIWGVVHFVR
jgi:hypothetical protein